MTGQQRLLLLLGVSGIVASAFVQGGVLPGVLAVLLVVAIMLLAMTYRREKRLSQSPHFGPLAFATFTVASAIAGGLYLTVFANMRLGPGPENLLWIIGIALGAGLMLRPRLSGVMLTVPIAIFGLFWMMAFAVTLQMPLD